MAKNSQNTTCLDAEGLWVDFPGQGEEAVFYASIFDCRGRRLAGHSFIVPDSKEKCRWNVNHTTWPKGAYVLVLKGERVLRQTLLMK
ncbi:hypothetical protein [Nafulsella turpanensis]|uniref:hypothetical protein n=1 Tax=Nafulsella turpanensis TaxID=1265690 RepID=UPI00034DBCE8|nr:hypothetical protein [Nafulsella turpanensis]